MFESLFKRSGVSGAPKTQIEITCPACSGRQFEPKLVLSTFCRSCGVHLSVGKKGLITASKVTRSGAAGVDDLWANAQPTLPKKPKTAPPPEENQCLPEPQPREHNQQSAPDAPPPPVAVEEPQTAAPKLPPAAPGPTELQPVEPAAEAGEEITGFGSFLQAVSPDHRARRSSKDPIDHPTLPGLQTSTPEAVLTKLPANIASTVCGRPLEQQAQAPAPPPNTTLGRMMAKSSVRAHHFKEIECFECGHTLKVSRSTKNAECTSCGAAIPCGDLDINLPHDEPIRTRGDVTIRKHGQVSSPLILCRNIKCFGIFTGDANCDDEITFRAKGTIPGDLTCRKLTVEKTSDLNFSKPLHATEMFINGRVTGTLIADHRLVIGPYGVVVGDVSARSFSIELGGELDGVMTVLSGPAPSE